MGEILNLSDRVQAALKGHPDNMDLKLAASGWSEASKTLAIKKTSAALKGLEAFEKRLLTMLDALEPVPPQEESVPWRWCTEAQGFPDPIPAGRGGPTMCTKYMQACGWDAKHSTVARHIKTGRLSMSCPEGWGQQHLNAYARAQFAALENTPARSWIPPAEQESRDARTGQDYAAQQGSLADAYKAAKLRGQELENELRELKLGFEQGRYVEAATLHEKSLALAVVLYARVKEELLAGIPALIRAAGGDPGQVAPVAQAVQSALDKGMQLATEQETYNVVFAEVGG